jgi:hypothetical protein
MVVLHFSNGCDSRVGCRSRRSSDPPLDAYGSASFVINYGRLIVRLTIAASCLAQIVITVPSNLVKEK